MKTAAKVVEAKRGDVRMKNAVNRNQTQLVTDLDPRSIVSEAYRILKTNLTFKNIERKLKNIAITSATPGEGKSTTAANLANSMAQSGKNVILVDADLRKPTSHKIFGFSVFEGLTNSLVEGTDPLSLCKTYQAHGPRILTAGTLPPNPSELLGSRRMKAVLDRLGEDADFVIIDCPPILGLNDSLALAPSVDGFLLVIGSGKVPKNTIMMAKQTLEKVEANILGAVLNGFDVRDGGSYHSYYSYGEQR